mgnify:CR=1 FL=1
MMPNGFNHAEAFALMAYRCEDCGAAEYIWNSRDGVTPFGVDCRECRQGAIHVDWKLDRFLPHYDPRPGDRYFRDGIEAEARAITRRRLEQGRGTLYEIPEDEWAGFIDEAVRDDGFRPGWPHLVERGTDADTLGPSRQFPEPPR